MPPIVAVLTATGSFVAKFTVICSPERAQRSLPNSVVFVRVVTVGGALSTRTDEASVVDETADVFPAMSVAVKLKATVPSTSLEATV